MAHFKVCGKCRHVWENRDAFLADGRNIMVSGYQASKEAPENGLYLFNHLKDSCNTTLAIKVSEFVSLYNDIPQYKEDFNGTPGCPGLCARIEEFRRCTNKCLRSAPRELIGRIITDYHFVVKQKQV